MWPHPPLFAVGGIDILGLCRAQVVPVEAAVLHDLAVAELYNAAPRRIRVELHPAGHVLAEVQNCLAFRGMYHLDGRELLLLHYLRATPGHKGDFFFIYHRAEALGFAPGLAPAGDGEVRVEVLAVVDIAEGHRGGVCPPAVVRAEDRLAAVLIGNVQLAYGVQGVAVQVVVAVEDHVPLVPARAQGKAHGVTPLPQELRHVEGLVFQVKVIAVIAGQQVLVPGLFAVYPQLVNTHAAGIGPGAGHVAGQADILGEKRLALLVGELPGGGCRYPFGLPGFVLLGGLKIGAGAGAVPAVAPDSHRPAVPLAGQQLYRDLIPQGGDVFPSAAVEDRFALQAHGDLCGGLLLVRSVVSRPGEYRSGHIKAQGLLHVIRAQMGQFHFDYLLSCSWVFGYYTACALTAPYAFCYNLTKSMGV